MLKKLIQSATRIHRQGSEKNIAIFSSARSGSTWLMELIATQPGFKYVDEPLHPDNLRKCKIVPPDSGWEVLLPRPKRNSDLSKYFENIESNRVHIGEPRMMSKFYRPITNRIVYKLLRCKDLMGWFASSFGWKIIYLIRHPLACSVSRQQFPRLKLFLENEEYVSHFLSSEQEEYARSIINNGTEFQMAVLDWCVQNIPAIKECDNNGWTTVFYENLICQPEVEIARLTDELNLPEPEKMISQVRVASESTSQSSAQTQKVFASNQQSSEFLLSKWRKEISNTDEETGFEILEVFGY